MKDSELDRLIKIYSLATEHKIVNDYPTSDHWKEYYNAETKKNFIDREKIKNFRFNHFLSHGCDDSHGIKASFLDLYEFIKKYNIDDQFLTNNLPKINVGNNNSSYKFLNFYLDYAEINHLKWVMHFKNRINKSDIKTTCEIGGGFGSLARIILNNYDTKYILIDLPEANLISSYFLKKHFPDKKFYLYDNLLENLSFDDFNNYDIFVLPPWAIKKFHKDIKIDFFVNTYSFMEMKKNIIKNYFEFIQTFSTSKSYFLNINRYQKDTSGEVIKFSEYPYDKNWECIICEKSPTRSNMHFLLAKRNFNNANIFDELKKITLIEKSSINSTHYSKFSNIPLLGKIDLIFKKIVRKIIVILFGIKLLNKIGKKLYNIRKENI